MRHVAVRRTALLLAIVLVGCAALFAWLVGREAEPAPATLASEGAAPFQEYCASCHAEERLRPLVAAADSARRLELERFLRSHGRSSDAEDRLILDYLRGADVVTPPEDR